MTASGASSDNKVASSPPRAAARNASTIRWLSARCPRRSRLRHALHLAPRPARQLAHSRTRAPHDRADLVERITEHIVQDERSPLGRRQGIEDDLHRVARLLSEQRVGLRVIRSMVVGHLGFDHQPGPPFAKLVEAEPRHDGCEPGGQVIDGVGAREPKPGFLKDVVRIGLRPEYPDGDGGQTGPLDFEMICHFHRGHTILTQGTSRM